MTPHYQDLGSDASIHQYGISALFSQTSFGGETSSVAKCRPFSHRIWNVLNSWRIYVNGLLAKISFLSVDGGSWGSHWKIIRSNCKNNLSWPEFTWGKNHLTIEDDLNCYVGCALLYDSINLSLSWPTTHFSSFSVLKVSRNGMFETLRSILFHSWQMTS